MPWAPTTGRMGMALSILSYAGEVRLGILTDEGLVPGPETILTEFQAEFEALLVAAQGVGRLLASSEVAERSSVSVEPVEPRPRADPQDALGILGQG